MIYISSYIINLGKLYVTYFKYNLNSKIQINKYLPIYFF